MSRAVFVLTKDVKHIASWTQDRESTATSWPTGTYRPICGGKVRDWPATFWPDVDYEDQRRVRRANRLPVCRYCAKTLASLVDLAGGAS